MDSDPVLISPVEELPPEDLVEMLIDETSHRWTPSTSAVCPKTPRGVSKVNAPPTGGS